MTVKELRVVAETDYAPASVADDEGRTIALVYGPSREERAALAALFAAAPALLANLKEVLADADVGNLETPEDWRWPAAHAAIAQAEN